MMKKIMILALVAIAVFSSCVSIEDFKILSIDEVELRSMSKIDVGITVENKSGLTIKLLSANLSLDQQGATVLQMLIKDELEMPKKKVSSIQIPVHIKVKNVMAAMAIASDIKRAAPNLTVSGVIEVKAGWKKQKFELNNVPLSQFMNTFGEMVKQ